MRIISILLAGIVLCVPTLSQANEKLFVQVPAILDPAAPIVSSVKNECGVELLIGNHVLQKVGEVMPGTAQLADGEKVGQNKFLQLTILSVHGVGGGSWSGTKAITIRAQLLKNGEPIRTTILQRRSGGGVFGGLNGTCAIMERIAIALGRDVANWLKNPNQATPPVDMSAIKDQQSEQEAGAAKP